MDFLVNPQEFSVRTNVHSEHATLEKSTLVSTLGITKYFI